MTHNFEDFKEQMQHEISSCCIILSSYGYKLDGNNGIKTKLRIVDSGNNSPKSFDYIQLYNNKIFFIEFSDLEAQYSQLNGRHSNVQERIKNLPLCDYKSINKILKAERQIEDEVTGKINDTDFILREIVNNELLQNFVDLEKERHIFIIWHSTNPYGIDLARIFEDLRGKIISKISRFNLEYMGGIPIYFLTVETYQTEYGSAM